MDGSVEADGDTKRREVVMRVRTSIAIFLRCNRLRCCKVPRAETRYTNIGSRGDLSHRGK